MRQDIAFACIRSVLDRSREALYVLLHLVGVADPSHCANRCLYGHQHDQPDRDAYSDGACQHEQCGPLASECSQRHRIATSSSAVRFINTSVRTQTAGHTSACTSCAHNVDAL